MAISSVISHKKTDNMLLFYSLVFLSGMTGLGYQIIWSQMLATSLGHEITAILAVIAAFFMGLTLGGITLNKLVKRSKHAHLIYVACEVLIGCWAILLALIIPFYNQWMPPLIGLTPSPLKHWFIAFIGTFLLLLPATFAMGATLPAIERFFTSFKQKSKKVPALYASNTLGAVFGTVFATFCLLPIIGLKQTSLLFAAINLLCAFAFYKISIGVEFAEKAPSVEEQPNNKASTQLLVMLFVTGLCGLAYEVIIVRLLSQILENTVYTFSAILSIYLLGTAVGAAIYQKIINKKVISSTNWQKWLNYLLIATAISGAIGIAILTQVESLYKTVITLIQWPVVNALLAEFSVAISILLLPTLVMGALFSHISLEVKKHQGLGLAMGINTLGAAIAPLLFGVILLPLIGSKLALLMVLLSYLVLSLLTSIKKQLLPKMVSTTFLVLLFFMIGKLQFLNITPQSKVLAYQEGVMASVAVIEDPNGFKHLKINNHFTMGGTATRLSDHRQSHIPLQLHGKAESVLYLGLGTGVSFDAAQYYPNTDVTAVELVPEMIPLMPYFDVNTAKWINQPKVYSADARRFVLSDKSLYDVIIAEIFHPSRDGAGFLYTKEHFTAIKARLNPQGQFCQWLPLFQLDLSTLKTITKTFLEVFPYAELHAGHFSLQQPILCLIGRNEAPSYEKNWLMNRVFNRNLQRELIATRLNSDFELFGGYLAGHKTLQDWAKGSPTNTDNKPIVTYLAPNFVYYQKESHGKRFVELNKALKKHKQEEIFITDTSSQNFAKDLENYWQARDIFIETGLMINPQEKLITIIEKTKVPLLEAARLSEHFEPAYRSLLGMATTLYQSDNIEEQKVAYQLLKDVYYANRNHPEAGQLLRHIQKP